MTNYIDAMKLERKKKVEIFSQKHGVDKITIPVYDFIILFECIEQLCSEYAGAKEIEDVYAPVFEKYYGMKLFEE